MLYYLISNSEHLSKETIIRQIDQIPKKSDIKKHMTTILQQTEQQGIEKGREEGREQGKLQLLMKLIDTKFKEEATGWIEKLNSLPPEKIEIIAERILTKDNLKEVFEGTDDVH